MAIYQTEVILRPDFYICAGARVMDFSVNDLESLLLIIELKVNARPCRRNPCCGGKLIMLKQIFLLNQPDNVSVEPLKNMLKSLATIDEETWGLYEFSKDMLRDKIDNKEKMEIVIKSIECGRVGAQVLKARLGSEVCISNES